MKLKTTSVYLFLAAPLLVFGAGSEALNAAPASGVAWWIWPLLLFGISFIIGIIAAMGGVGGGVLFVPIVSSFFPFHLDYVRGTALIMALSGALSASPPLLRDGLTNLRLTLPMALVASISAMVGARVGLILPPEAIQTALGVLILVVAVIMMLGHHANFPTVVRPGWLASHLHMEGTYWDATRQCTVPWRVHRALLGLLLFTFIGFIAGVFGLGAGWANVPVLNLVMGAPLKVAVASSSMILATSNTSAAWIYLHQGAVLALITVPAVVGIMLGSPLGARLLVRMKPSSIRIVVVAILIISGVRALLKGLGLWL